MPAPKAQSIFLYEKIANRITELIQKGTYRSGDRIPSVRQTSKQQGVSISTVLQAYLVLENKGLIEARPQSGYYVRAAEFDQLPEPETSSPSLDPSQVSLQQLMMMVLPLLIMPETPPAGSTQDHT